ncbi:MAG: cation:proton antiporter [Candidatus Omnitrophica bacterium]|nr:cation:proton antiporter [Candidatus Omnitrophota bacterium]MBU1894419.1 cation:proton antiporter [Candidatus Omnitrophota bacterium]
MNGILIGGVVLFIGFIFGEIAQKIKLPKVTGYIFAGILLNPSICHFIPANLAERTDNIENMALAFIAFSIGGTLLYARVKKLGKGILYITVLEAEVAFLAITAGFLVILPIFTNVPQASWVTIFVPGSLLVGCLGSPTDPSVGLAIKHAYKAEGEVTSTMLSVAAFDDVLGIINYSVAVVLAAAIATHQAFNLHAALFSPLAIITGSLLLGIIFGIIFNFITSKINKETEGVFIVIILSLLALCFGLSTWVGVDQLLSTMTMGIVVVNFNKKQEKIFQMMERYIEEMVFVLFFTLSGLHLNFSVVASSLVLILFFIVFRTAGKFLGTFIGGVIAGSSPKVRAYTAYGLIPQGGIVIGLALMMGQNPAFKQIADIVISIIVATTVINEFIGPIILKKALKKAGEI